jgi:hypothetical protein
MPNGYVPKNSNLQSAGQFSPANRQHLLPNAESFGAGTGKAGLVLSQTVCPDCIDSQSLLSNLQNIPPLPESNVANATRLILLPSRLRVHPQKVPLQYFRCNAVYMEPGYPEVRDESGYNGNSVVSE